MIEVSKEFNDYINSFGRTFRAKLVLTNGYEFSDEIRTLKLADNFTSFNIGIGECCGACVDVVLNANITFKFIEFELLIGAEINRKMEWISMGTFTAENPKNVRGVVSFTGYSTICSKFNGNYKTSLTFPTTTKAIVEEICRRNEIKFITDIPALPIEQNVFSLDMTDMDVIAYIAAYHGTNARVNRKGQLEFAWFKETSYELGDDRYAEPTLEVDDNQINAIQCNNGAEVLTSGLGDVTFKFNCPLMTQKRLDEIQYQLTPFQYRVAQINMIMGDPRIEAGDVITIELRGKKYVIPVMGLVLNFDGGISCQISSFGQSPSQLIRPTISERFNQVTMSTQKKLSQMEETAQAFAAAAASTIGCYETEEFLPNGMKIHYWHDKPKLEDSMFIRKSNENGYFITNGGLNGQWYGLDKNANAFLETLTAKSIVANSIVGGVLQGMKIIADDIEITGGKINMEGEAAEQFIVLREKYDISGGEGSTAMKPEGIIIKNSGGYRTNIESSGIIVALNGKNGFQSVDIMSDGINTTEGEAFSCNQNDHSINWGNKATNYLKGNWYGLVNSSSDRNKKHNIEPLDGKYKEFFKALQPVRFIYNEQGDEKYNLGYIAQDVKEALENAGLSTDDFAGYSDQNDIISLCYAQFTALNTAIIQDQQKQIDELLKRIEALEK